MYEIVLGIKNVIICLFAGVNCGRGLQGGPLEDVYQVCGYLTEFLLKPF